MLMLSRMAWRTKADSTVRKAGNRVLMRTKALLDAADIATPPRRPRWDGPFTVTGSGPACPSPISYTLALRRRTRDGAGRAPVRLPNLALLRRMRCGPPVNKNPACAITLNPACAPAWRRSQAGFTLPGSLPHGCCSARLVSLLACLPPPSL